MSPNINPIFNGLTVKLALEPMEARFLIISLCSVDKGGAFSNKSVMNSFPSAPDL